MMMMMVMVWELLLTAAAGLSPRRVMPASAVKIAPPDVERFWHARCGVEPGSRTSQRLVALADRRPALRPSGELTAWVDETRAFLPTADVAAIVARYPGLVAADPDQVLWPKVALLQAALPRADVGRLVTLAPSLLRQQMTTVTPKIGDLRALLPGADVEAMIMRSPALLTCDVKRTVLAKLAELRLHIAQEDLQALDRKVEADPALLLVGFGALWRLAFLRERTSSWVPLQSLASILKAAMKSFESKYPDYRGFLLSRLDPAALCEGEDQTLEVAETCALVEDQSTAELQRLCGQLLRDRWARYTGPSPSGTLTSRQQLADQVFAPRPEGASTLDLLGRQIDAFARTERRLKDLSQMLAMPLESLTDLLNAVPELATMDSGRLERAGEKFGVIARRLPNADATRLLARAPGVATGPTTAAELDDRLSNLEDLLGTTADLHRVVRLAPTLLLCDPESLRRKLADLEALLPGANTRQLVVRSPTLLTADVQTTVGAKMDALERLLPTCNASALARRCPALLQSDFQISVPRKLSCLRRLLPGTKIDSVIAAAPSLLLRDTASLERRMAELRTAVRDLREGDEVDRGDLAVRMVAKAPSILTADVNANLRPKMAALADIMMSEAEDGPCHPAVMLASNPRLLTAGFGAYGRLCFLGADGNGVTTRSASRALKLSAEAFAREHGAERYRAFLRARLGTPGSAKAEGSGVGDDGKGDNDGDEKTPSVRGLEKKHGEVLRRRAQRGQAILGEGAGSWEAGEDLRKRAPAAEGALPGLPRWAKRMPIERSEALSLISSASAPGKRRLEALLRLADDDPLLAELRLAAGIVAGRVRTDVDRLRIADRAARTIYDQLLGDEGAQSQSPAPS